MVKLEGVTKTFKKAVVVQEVTAEFRQGEPWEVGGVWPMLGATLTPFPIPRPSQPCH